MAASSDSFVREIKNGVCYIYGGSDRGTLYGTYDFIEDVLGVKFISSDVTITPQVSAIELSKFDGVSESPAFEIRSQWTTDTQVDAKFSARKRLTSPFYNENLSSKYGGGMYNGYYNPGHNLESLITSGGGTVSGTICLSDTTTRNYVVQGLKKLTDTYTTCKYFAVKLEDGYKPTSCTCSSCTGKTDSNLLVDFVNYIATEINKTAGREIYVVTYAYGETEVPPTVSVNDHVVIELAPIKNINLGSSLSKQSTAFTTCLNGWKEKVDDRLWFYGYSTNFGNYGWYSLNLSLMQTNLSYLQNTVKVGSVIMEDNHFIDFTDWQADLRTYVASVLMWNPAGYSTTESIYALAKEFCVYYFGETAGSVVYDFIVASEARLEKARNGEISGLTYYVKDTDNTLDDINYACDTNNESHPLTANSYKLYEESFLTDYISKIKTVYNSASGDYKKRIASVLFTVELQYFANHKHYGTVNDSTYQVLKIEVDNLITVLDGGYSAGELRYFYNSRLFKTVQEVNGGDTSSDLLPATSQNKAFMTNAASGTKAGFYMYLSENGESHTTSDWSVSTSGTVTAKYGDKTYTCVLKGSGMTNRFFIDVENVGSFTKYDTMTITIQSGTITNNGSNWHVESDIVFNVIFDGTKWCVENYL